MSNIRKTIVTNCEKKFLIKSLSEYVRIDGRAFDEFRPFEINFGKDWGCCYVALGKTKVVAQVSCEVQSPKSSRPSEGILNVNIELNPIAAPNFEAGRQSELSVQLNRLLEKCLKDSKAVDLESLCIKANEKVWAFRVDVNILNHEGNILDCASVAALAALAHFRRPDVTCDGEEFVVHSYQERDPIPTVIHHYPICVTYAIFNGGEFIVADPTLLEEGVSDAFLTVALNAYKELCGLHLGGKAELAPDTILQTANKAAMHVTNVVQQIKDSVENDGKIRAEHKHISFQSIQEVEKNTFDTTELTSCLDQWSTFSKKAKKKKAKEDKNAGDEPMSKVEVFDKGSATLTGKNKNDEWGASSSEDEAMESEVQIIEKPVEVVNVNSGDSSEEEAVIVLHADQKTNKKKRFRK